ncbi:hypothetical protein [Pseudomonas sp. BN411]|uniref:hypothetical protein n=1 Tax=Pseudomonas sp. BN411 TaxID=2567887 RepID=UPI002455BCAA|nr:hypothetical protein [Pseudomonas sp. BN411]MDH4564135.1 hypothetical protein [Pseudomonas sp. BN411]
MKNTRNLIAASAIASCVVWAAYASAAEPIRHEDWVLEPSLMVTLGYINGKNQDFGSSSSIIGSKIDRSSKRFEGMALPGLKLTHETEGFGDFYGAGSVMGAFSHGDTDAVGLARGNPRRAAVEELYVGWKSADLFPQLGQDALKLSAGRQAFYIGDGFLIGDGHLDQGRDGAGLMGLRLAFDRAVVAQLDHENLHVDMFDLLGNYDIDALDYRDRLGMRGVNIEWRGEENLLGLTRLRTRDADVEQRDDLDVSMVRLNFANVVGVPDLDLNAGYVDQKKSDNEHAWYAGVEYTFSDKPWRPSLKYMHSEFSPGYDLLAYGCMDTYGNWYQGKITDNIWFFKNSRVNMYKVSVQPIDTLKTGLMFYDTRLYDKRGVSAYSDFSSDINLYVEWQATERLSAYFLGGYARPGKAAEEILGSNDDSVLVAAALTWYY